jgi:adenine deaminase
MNSSGNTGGELTIKGNIVDIPGGEVYPGEILIKNGFIHSIIRLAAQTFPGLAGPVADRGSQPGGLPFIMPGFIDAHVHIESSLLVPSEFARLAVIHGTVATVSDPHEIANVCGQEGVEFMIRNGSSVPFHFNFGAPSCVPATVFETAGASLDAAAVVDLLSRPEIRYLSEMMNFPGVLNKDPEVMRKIAAAQAFGKQVDGHAPGLRGEQARQYIAAGISTDHECFTAEEALDKIGYGMKILIREGSAARNFEALADLLNDHWQNMMFCSDDKHPDSLVAGHIDRLCARAVVRGVDVFKVLHAACINPANHYSLPHGLLREGDPADFILVEDLKNFRVLQTYINGQLVADKGHSMIPSVTAEQNPINYFNAAPHTPQDFGYPLDKWGEEENIEQVYCIEALDGQLITNKLVLPLDGAFPSGGYLHSDPANDILKIVVVNRYREAPVAKSFIHNFGLKRGALASSVAHDSHNIVAVGVDKESICQAVNLVIEARGGLSCVDPGDEAQNVPASQRILPLPVAGLMTMQDGFRIAEDYTAIDRMAKALGSSLGAPFMTLSFMALLVIPHIKLSDLGLFDGDTFRLL